MGDSKGKGRSQGWTLTLGPPFLGSYMQETSPLGYLEKLDSIHECTVLADPQAGQRDLPEQQLDSHD